MHSQNCCNRHAESTSKLPLKIAAGFLELDAATEDSPEMGAKVAAFRSYVELILSVLDADKEDTRLMSLEDLFMVDFLMRLENGNFLVEEDGGIEDNDIPVSDLGGETPRC